MAEHSASHPETSPAETAYEFGPFRLIPSRRALLNGAANVSIGSRALDVLIALVERAGHTVAKHELMVRAWPRVVVGESSLKVAVAELRRVLGDSRDARRYVVNIPGRGYVFVAHVLCRHVDCGRPEWKPSAEHKLPCLPTRLIGRADTLSTLSRALEARRLVTIVGPGGIGKTAVAVAIAKSVQEDPEQDVCFVDLAAVSDPHFVPAALAQALGVVVHSEDVPSALAMALRSRRVLIVLDSCERVLCVVTALVERILGATLNVRILATSREALRVPGEIVHRLAPLAFPRKGADLMAAEALAFPAVMLFVEQASASDERFSLSDADVPFVIDICSKLEGLPLAIELAATRVEAFSLRELDALLENRLRLINLSRRGALPRHACLTATLDWSHDLLSEDEQKVFRRLAVFSHAFTLGAAIAVAGEGLDVANALNGLVSKSLVCAEVGGAAGRYCLLDTTRAYAAKRLEASGELHDLRRRRDAHHLDMLTHLEQASCWQQSAEWLADDEHAIDDV